MFPMRRSDIHLNDHPAGVQRLAAAALGVGAATAPEAVRTA